jgi:hypothetical protein
VVFPEKGESFYLTVFQMRRVRFLKDPEYFFR